jgi:ribosome-associated toxin RatA of RatAB toxin-antitoxin module
MRQVRRSALVAATPERMFELINEVERYPEFVPGCAAATVLSRTPSEIHARLTVGRGPLRTAFTTRNHLIAHRQVRMELVEGPFRSLQGLWTLAPVTRPGTAEVVGCRVSLELDFEPNSGLAGLALGPLIEQTVNSLVDAFVSRARIPDR